MTQRSYISFRNQARKQFPRYRVNGTSDQINYSKELARFKEFQGMLESKYPDFRVPGSNHNRLYNFEFVNFHRGENESESEGESEEDWSEESEEESSGESDEESDEDTVGQQRPDEPMMSFKQYKALIQKNYPNYRKNMSKDNRAYSKELNNYQNKLRIMNKERKMKAKLQNESKVLLDGASSAPASPNPAAEKRMGIKSFQLLIRRKYPNYADSKSQDNKSYCAEIAAFKKEKRLRTTCDTDLKNNVSIQTGKASYTVPNQLGSLKEFRALLGGKYPGHSNVEQERLMFDTEIFIYRLKYLPKTTPQAVQHEKSVSDKAKKKYYIKKSRIQKGLQLLYPHYKSEGEDKVYYEHFLDEHSKANPKPWLPASSPPARPTLVIAPPKKAIQIDQDFVNVSGGIVLGLMVIRYLPEDVALLGVELDDIPKTFDSHVHYRNSFKCILFEELKSQAIKVLVSFGAVLDEQSKSMDLSNLHNFHSVTIRAMAGGRKKKKTVFDTEDDDDQDQGDLDKAHDEIKSNRFAVEFSLHLNMEELKKKNYGHPLNALQAQVVSNSDIVVVKLTIANKDRYLFALTSGVTELTTNHLQKNPKIEGVLNFQRTADTNDIITSLENSNDTTRFQPQIQTVINLTTFTREVRALNYIEDFDHFQFMINPTLEEYHAIRDNSGTFPIAPAVLAGLRLNESQLGAVKDSLHRNGINLIQGPPGTGKTTVIISLISILLAVKSSIRVLVCAPSHTAIDEIGRRIIKQKIPDASGKMYTPQMVRVGRKEMISEDLHQIAFDHGTALNTKISRVNSSRVILATLAGAGSRLLFEKTNPPDVIIVDECTQSSEATNIIPFCLADKIVLIGDPLQLPPTVFSDDCKRHNFDRSLFERLCFAIPRSLLTIQYRMHPSIAHFPSSKFYQGRIKNGENVEQYEAPFYADPRYKPLNFYDITDSVEETINKSIKNTLEIKLVFALIKKLIQDHPKTRFMSWGIITPYKLQKHEIQMRKIGFNERVDIQVNTVDGFQGGEKDIIIFSTVRRDKIGFLSDTRRINVGITRAKYGFFVIGSFNLLQKDPTWREYTSYIRSSNCTFNRINENGIITMQNEIDEFDKEHPEFLVQYDDNELIDEDDDDEMHIKLPYRDDDDDESEADSDDSDEEEDDDDEVNDLMGSLTLDSGGGALPDISNIEDLTPGNRKKAFKMIEQYRMNLDEFKLTGSTLRFSDETEKLFLGLYNRTLISPDNCQLKLKSFDRLKEALRMAFPSAGVDYYGSLLNGVSSNSSDVDVSIQMESSNKTLHKVAKYLKKSGYAIETIRRKSKVPLIKFKDQADDISYDLCFGNANAVRNSYLVKAYSLLDVRAKQLMLLVKIWAKSVNINDASQHTLSSYALINMVIYYLQCLNPPVLPNLQANGATLLTKDLKSFQPSPKPANQSIISRMLFSIRGHATTAGGLPLDFNSLSLWTLGQLFYGFFKFYSSFNFKNQLISIRLGYPNIPSRMASQQFQKDNSKSPIQIEDPFEINRNIAKSVNYSHSIKIFYQICKNESILRSEAL